MRAIVRILLIASLAAGLVVPAAADADPVEPRFVGELGFEVDKDEVDSVFWEGGLVGADTEHSLPVGDIGVSTCDNSPCFRYTLRTLAPAHRLRVALDVPARDDGFFVEVTGPDDVVASGRNANQYNVELWIDDAPRGEYTILVRPYSADNTIFRMRAKLEAAEPARTPDDEGLLKPNLRMTPPWEFGFVAPANPANGLFPPDDANPPLDVAGVHPLSCALDEMAEDGARRCLRFSFGLENAGPGPFHVRRNTAEGDRVTGPLVQCVQRVSGTPLPHPAGTYELHKTHGHYHFSDIIVHELLRVTDPFRGVLAVVGDGRKVGYSPADQALAGWEEFTQGRPFTHANGMNCLPGNEPSLGLSIGWGDAYRWQRPGNYVEFGDSPDGRYVVRTTADPLNRVLETNDADNTAYTYVEITGEDVKILELGRGRDPWDPDKIVFTDYGRTRPEPANAGEGAPGAVTTVAFQFVPPLVVASEGSTLTYVNADIAPHNVQSDKQGPDGKPLFVSAVIEAGQTAPVEGVSRLAPGDYGFFCIVHPSMRGTLRVTDT